MPSRWFKGSQDSQDFLDRQSFVSLGTIRGMAAVSKNLALARKAFEEIAEIEEGLKKNENREVLKQKTEWTEHCARSAGEAIENAIRILKRMTTEAGNYLKDLKNVTY